MPCDGALVVRPASPQSPVVPVIIYYDLTSVESLLLSDAINNAVAEPGLEWRGVQMDPSLPVPARLLNRHERGRLEMDVSDAMRSTPSLRIVTPTILPNTRRALVAVASVDCLHRSRAGEFRATLFREYWWGGADLSDSRVLQRAADAAGVPPGVDLEQVEAATALAKWELDWKTEALGGVPRAIREDGQILWGARNGNVVREFFITP